MAKRITALLALFVFLFSLVGCDLLQTGGTSTTASTTSTTVGEFKLSDVPDYSGTPYVEMNGNVPYFSEDDLTTESYETYSDLDSLGRCGTAMASIGRDLMPTGERGSIRDIHPTGWHSSFYDFVDQESLYNRCHLIAWKLTAEDHNEKNLITGTRYMNKDGMLPFEDEVSYYLYKHPKNHVLYRVTPIFVGDELVARGVLMEAESVEDKGKALTFCVYCYNVQPGVSIDYATGDNELDKENTYSLTTQEDTEGTYILNTNSMKFHKPDCEGVADISSYNKEKYTGSRNALLEKGYQPCGICNP